MSGLTDMTIPNSVTSIGSGAFKYCTGLASVVWNSENYVDFNESPFSDCSVNSFIFGESVEHIPAYLCSGMTDLTEITIPNSVTSIGNSAFYGCDGLTSVEIPSSVTSIGESTFSGCSGLTSIEIPNSVTTIGDQAFSGCTGLASIEIPNSVTEIGNSVFSGCIGLSSIEIPSSVTSIGSSAFEDCIKAIWFTNTPPTGYEKSGAKINYVANDLYTGLSRVKVYPYLSSIFEVGGVKYVPVSPSERTCDAIDCVYNSNITDIEMGSTVSNMGVEMTVKEIMPYTFYNQDYIETINILNADNIGESAFEDCRLLTEIFVPKSVKSIGHNSFRGCKSLADVIISDRDTELSLGSNGSSPLFADCPLDSVYIGGKIVYDTSSKCGYSPFYKNNSLRMVTITDKETEIYDNEFYGCSNLTKVVIGDGVEKIGNRAFNDCNNLTNVTIGDGVKKIGNWAFSGCSSLDYFVFGTNVETIGEEAFSDCTNVSQIISYSVTPPVCGTQALDDINKWTCTLKVIEGAVSDYQSAEQWKEFFFIEGLPIEGKVATPVITLDDRMVTISCETEKTKIYYTIDGSEPTTESNLYSEPFIIDRNCTIKALATRTNYNESDIATLEVTLGVNEVENQDFLIKVDGNNIIVCDAQIGETIRVFAADGSLMTAKGVADTTTVISVPASGLYLVKVGNQTAKVLVK